MLDALDRRGAEALEVPVGKEAGDRYVAHQLMIGTFGSASRLRPERTASFRVLTERPKARDESQEAAG
jgi:hypothetical protein